MIKQKKSNLTGNFTNTTYLFGKNINLTFKDTNL